MKTPKDEGSYTGNYAIEILTSEGWTAALSGVKQFPLRCQTRQEAYERAVAIMHSGRQARVVEVS